MTEQQQVEAGKRIEAFLADDAIKAALVDLEKRYVSEFKDSKTPAEREAIHAKMVALQDLFASALGTVTSGKFSQHKLDVANRQRTPRSR